MQRYPLTAYPWRPSEWHENEDRDWGPYRWPQGTPASLRTSVYTADGTEVSVRTELAPLFRALHILSEEVYGYPLHTKSGGYTGGYDNRPIAGTNTASSHSRATTADYRAIDNPQSWTFTSTWPPELIYHWTRAGFYWGGYYRGAKYDAMHQAYGLNRSDVAASFAYVKSVLAQHSIAIRDDGTKIEGHKGGGSSAPTPPTPPAQPAPPQPAPPVAPKAPGGVTAPGVTIRQVQSALNSRGASLAVDGIWGPATSAAVAAFQRTHGLAVDSYVGPKTWAALVPTPAKPYTPPPGPFSLPRGHYYGLITGPAQSHGGYYASERPAVKWIQIRMQQLGYAPTNPGWADGKFEQPTKDAVAAWQRARHVSTTSRYGEVWADDWANLTRDR